MTLWAIMNQNQKDPRHAAITSGSDDRTKHRTAHLHSKYKSNEAEFKLKDGTVAVLWKLSCTGVNKLDHPILIYGYVTLDLAGKPSHDGNCYTAKHTE